MKFFPFSFFKTSECSKARNIKHVQYCTASFSHPGQVRLVNEDSFLAKPEQGLWIVADGMGGHENGEVASRLAVQQISTAVESGKTLPQAVNLAHSAIVKENERTSLKKPMGSTVVAVKIDGLNYQIAWVGDSRAYLWNGKLRQLTVDHSYVQLLIDAGIIAKEDANAHPQKNIIHRALGIARDFHGDFVDCVSGSLNLNDTLLLCTDGLHGEVEQSTIEKIFVQTNGYQQRIDQLFDAAMQAGGRDNITLITITPHL